MWHRQPRRSESRVLDETRAWSQVRFGADGNFTCKTKCVFEPSDERVVISAIKCGRLIDPRLTRLWSIAESQWLLECCWSLWAAPRLSWLFSTICRLLNGSILDDVWMCDKFLNVRSRYRLDVVTRCDQLYFVGPRMRAWNRNHSHAVNRWYNLNKPEFTKKKIHLWSTLGLFSHLMINLWWKLFQIYLSD